MSDLKIEITEAIAEVLEKYRVYLELDDRDTYEVAEAMLNSYLEGEI